MDFRRVIYYGLNKEGFPVRTKIATTMVCVVALAAAAQVKVSPVNNSRSNIKNNIAFSQGPGGKLVCTTQNKPCTAEQVQALAAYMRGGQIAPNSCCPAGPPGERCPCRPFASDVASIALTPEGTLKCQTKDGKACTAAHLADLNKAAVAMKTVGDPIGSVGIGLGKKPNPSAKN
jgi:hypothetical protein